MIERTRPEYEVLLTSMNPVQKAAVIETLIRDVDNVWLAVEEIRKFLETNVPPKIMDLIGQVYPPGPTYPPGTFYAVDALKTTPKDRVYDAEE